MSKLKFVIPAILAIVLITLSVFLPPEVFDRRGKRRSSLDTNIAFSLSQEALDSNISN